MIQLIYEHKDKKVTVELPLQSTWPELQHEFKEFLRGIGYIIPYSFDLPGTGEEE